MSIPVKMATCELFSDRGPNRYTLNVIEKKYNKSVAKGLS